MDFNRPQKQARKGLALALGLFSATASLAANSALVFVSAPTADIRQDTVIRFTVGTRNPSDTIRAGCGLYVGPIPSGSTRAGHTKRIANVQEIEGPNKTRLLTFRPSDPDTSIPGSPAKLSLGNHFLVAACPDTGNLLTPEIPLRVVTSQAPGIITPHASETNPRPEISWSAVPGVPAYHLLLSDQALQIDPKGGVSGASVIWQAIVTGTRITYGTPDPSGNFSQVPAPPLSPGIPYNLVVLNNYDGRSALATSTRAQGLRLFTLTPSGSPPGKPRIVAPAKGLSFYAPKDSQMVFRWTPSQGGDEVNVYQLYIYAADNQQGSTVLLPVWRGDFTDTIARLDAQRTLLSQRYIAKVFAVSASGLTSVSDTVSFAYTNKVQTLSLAARGPNGAGDTIYLENVRVTVTPVTGSGQPFPLYTAGAKRLEKQLAMGTYVLDFTKEGYLSDRREVVLNGKTTLQVNGFLPLASCLLQGRTVGDDGQSLDNVLIRLAAESNSPYEARSDAGGRWAMGLKPGRYRLSMSRDDYAPRADTLIDIEAGQTLNLGNLSLKKATGILSGTVTSEAGALPGAQITVTDGSGAAVRGLLADGLGRFQALLSPGTYRVAADFAGMTGAAQTINLNQSADLQLRLESGASIIRGRVRLLVAGSVDPPAPVKGALISLSQEGGKTVQKTVTDVNGEFSLSTAEAGDFTLIAAMAEDGPADTATFTLNGDRKTLQKDLLLKSLLNIQGNIKLNPDTALDASSLTVVLLDDRSDKLVRSGRVFRDSTGLHFLLESVPDGDFRLTASGGNYATEDEPLLTVSDGAAPSKTITLNLARANGSIVFQLAGGDSAIAGSVRILSPITKTLTSGDTLKPAGFGTYVLAANPKDSARIPLVREVMIIAKVTGKPSLVTLRCPFAHRLKPSKQSDGRYLFQLQEDFGLDSGYLSVASQNGFLQKISLRGKDAKLSGGVRQILVQPSPGATLLTYWFTVYQGGRAYSNEDPGRRYSFSLFKPDELAEIRLDVTDSLLAPAESRGGITVSALNAQGLSMDSILQSRGSLQWRHLGKQAFSLHAPAGNRLVFDAGKANAKGGIAWDTLLITAELDSQSRAVAVAVRIVQAKIHTIRVTTSLGDNPQMDAPKPFALRLLAFDTSYSPPLPLLPNPSFTIDPPEAGKMRGVLFFPDSDFIGPLRVLGHHQFADGRLLEAQLFPNEDALSAGMNIGQTLKPGAPKRTLRHGHQLVLSLPDSLIGGDEATVIRAYQRYLPKTFTSLKDAAVTGKVWEMTNPTGTPMRGTITLGLVADYSQKNRTNTLRRFDAIGLNWMPVDTLATEFDGRLRPVARAKLGGLDGNYWAVFTASEGTSAAEFSIMPNPFSPRVTALRDGNSRPGTRIRFRPDGDESPEITITLSVFTLEGERVRLLADHQTHPKSTVEYYWDGRTDDGRMARNGRYLLSLTLTPTGGGRTRHYLKPVVVFQ